jgi:hypothetical protein
MLQIVVFWVVTPVVLKEDTYILEKHTASIFMTDIFIPVKGGKGVVGTTEGKNSLSGTQHDFHKFCLQDWLEDITAQKFTVWTITAMKTSELAKA